MAQWTRSLASITATHSLFEANGRFLTFEIQGSGPHSGLLHSLEVRNCTFRQAGGHIFDVPIRKVDLPSATSIPLQVASCRFEDTSGNIFRLEMDSTSPSSLRQTAIRVANCSFRGTRDNDVYMFHSAPFSAVGETPPAAFIVLDTCSWSGECRYIFESHSMNWRMLVADSTVDRHSNEMAIFASGQGGCALDVDGLTLRDTYSLRLFGMIFAQYCTATLRNIRVFNFIFNSSSTRNALFQFKQAVAALENIDVIESGSSGYILFCFLTPLTMSNARILSPYIGGLGVIISALSDMSLRNLTFSDVLKREVSAGPALDRPVFIGWSAAHIEITDIIVDKQTYTLHGSGYWAVLVASIGTFSASGVRLDGLLTDSIAVLFTSSGSISNLTCVNVTFQTFALTMYRDSSLHICNASLERVTALQDAQGELSRHIRGLALVGSKCTLSATDLRIMRSNFTTFFVLSHASLLIQTIAIVEDFSTTFIEVCVDSVVSIADGVFHSGATGAISAIHSDLSLSRCIFHNVSVNTELFRVSESLLTLSEVQCGQLLSTTRLGRVSENSTLTIANSAWRGVRTLEGEGFVLSSCALHVNKSTFADFNFTFFRLSDSQYSISDSSVRDGWITVKSAKSQYAYGAFLSCTNCRQGSIEAISAYNLSALIGGALAFQNTVEVADSVAIVGSKFELCSAERGGAIYFSNAVFSVLDSVFRYNSAEKSGGAIEEAASTSRRLLQNCDFRGNRATAGGAVKWRNAPISLENVTFAHNEAEYGPDLASFPIALVSKHANTSPVGSGNPTSFQFLLVDHYGQVVTTADHKALQLLTSGAVNFKGNSVSFSSKGVFTFTDITIYTRPVSTQRIAGTVEDYFDDKKMHIRGTIDVTFRNCSIGEILRPDRCESCNVGNVSYSIFDADCTPCPRHAFCFGGSNMTVNSRHWRSAWNSTLVLECPLPDKCLGGPNSSCADGFTGKLCNQCANHTYRARVTECVECSGVVWLQLAGMWLTLSVFCFAVIRYGERHPDEFKLFVVKCFVNHGQLLSAMAPFRVSYPAVLKNSLRVAAYVSSLGVSDLPIACFGYSAPEYIRAVIGSAAFPLAAVSCLPSLLLFARNRQRAGTKLLTSLSLFTPAVTVQLVAILLACISAGTSDKWLFVDMSQKCWEGRHFVLIIEVLVPSILLSCALPMLLAIVLKLRFAATFQQHFPMWWAGNKLQLWDVFLTIAKCSTLWLMLNSISYDKLTQVAYGLVNLIVLCVLTVSLHMHVYKTAVCFFLAEASTVIVAASLGLGTYYVYSAPGNSATDYFIAVVFFVLNGGYFAACLALLCFNENHGLIHIPSEEDLNIPKIVNPHNSLESSVEANSEGGNYTEQKLK